MSKEPSKQLTVFSSETVNIKKLANLIANTKNYEQTLNTRPHSDPQTGVLLKAVPISLSHRQTIDDYHLQTSPRVQFVQTSTQS